MKRQVIEVLSGKGNTSALTTNDLFILVNEVATDIFVTGGTYSSGTTEFTFTNNTGGTFNVTGFYIPSATTAYKVFTALLTQSGGDNIQQLSSGTVTEGVTYQIQDSGTGDFSNVGAPNNNETTYFVAINNGTPSSWGDASLWYNTGAPVATVLENTIGNIWFTYADTGIYYINSSDLFTNNKTYTVIQLWGDDSIAPRAGFVKRQSSSELILFNKDYTGEFSLNGIADIGYLTSIEIRVYN